MNEPLFACQDDICETERSFHADMLHLFEGQPLCEDCFDNGDILTNKEKSYIGTWHDLPPFVPEFQKQIEQLSFVAETAYGHLWRVTMDVTTPNGSRLSEARRLLRVEIGKDGQARGIEKATPPISLSGLDTKGGE